MKLITYLKDEDSTLLGKVETEVTQPSDIDAHIEKLHKLEKVIENVIKNV